MAELDSLSIRYGKKPVVGYVKYPVALSVEERKTVKWCPLNAYYVTAFTCLQCPYYELHNQLTAVVTKASGKCLYPRSASIDSRRQTGAFNRKWLAANGGRQLAERQKQAGAMQDKIAFVAKLLEEGKSAKSKDLVFKRVKREYPEMSRGYFMTLYYLAKKFNRAKGGGDLQKPTDKSGRSLW